MLGKDRAKLSKRHGALSAMAYREQGFLPQSLLTTWPGWAGPTATRRSSPGKSSSNFSPWSMPPNPRGSSTKKSSCGSTATISKTEPAPELARELTPFLARDRIEPGPGLPGPGGAHPERPVQDLGGDGRGRPLLFSGPPALRREGGQKISDPGRRPTLREMAAPGRPAGVSRSGLEPVLSRPGRGRPA